MRKSLDYLAWLEGLSLIVLLGIAMPLKYIWDWPLGVEVVGMAHGLFFIGYSFLLAWVGFKGKWSLKVMALSFAAAFIPFGTFYVAKRLW